MSGQAVLSRYYAHSAEGVTDSEWQLLSDHLISVGQKAAQKAGHFGATELAEIAGLLHDLGKYTVEFQQRLRGSTIKVDHSTHGALIALQHFKHNPLIGTLLAYSIAGHHAGLADTRETSDKQTITDLQRRLAAKELPLLDDTWKQEIDLKTDINKLTITPLNTTNGIAFQLSVLGRMIYSCLVDADFLDTEDFYNRIENQPARDSDYPSVIQLKAELDQYLSQPKFQSGSGINTIRQQILSTARQQAEQSPGLFSLNVPTGGGKTLTSLAFALDHAVAHGLRRVILVIPFTSIVEQNAAVWREALGTLGDLAVLEHHSAFNADKQDYADPNSKDKLRQAAENWEPPVIVTTAVQFFESLFANRSSRCRKLHNIANSVVILDEAQTLPTKLLKPCVAMIKELALNYRTSLVLCTATQPALQSKDGFEQGLDYVRELIPEPEQLHKTLERVSVEYIGERSDAELIQELRQHDQVLCIVNNRRHARALFESIRDMEGSAHLTTLMCADHRSVSLTEIRQRLIEGQPVRLISTSLIEAGVDVDFPAVYRAETGLDSIAQAAGRCNREGKRHSSESKVRVFRADKQWSVPPEIEQYAAAFRAICRKFPDDLLSPGAVQEYFKEVYWQKGKALDAGGIMELSNLSGTDLDIAYDQMAQRFRMIESNMQAVIVPYLGDANTLDQSEVGKHIRALEFVDKPGAVARQLQRYLVQVPERGLKALMAYGAVQAIHPERFGGQFLLLENTGLYDPECGLSWDNPAYLSAERTIF
ncbi:MAG: CRISPR-associated helicase/endonuclease Cas3 [Oceanospirillaceae bacterium]|nr:CRISPR-associated helicase/endonuclease Cas3 [Oceanospirillaceae bacterium]MBT10828.1 CRISPR-associated helicase/endonuclease Cas3 [Oceanospirillaceae bacterium]|tara:strand:+ start:13348 stop:15639 length:2292 start_codon:yes stop_codon:yes gene_type:complete